MDSFFTWREWVSKAGKGCIFAVACFLWLAFSLGMYGRAAEQEAQEKPPGESKGSPTAARPDEPAAPGSQEPATAPAAEPAPGVIEKLQGRIVASQNWVEKKTGIRYYGFADVLFSNPANLPHYATFGNLEVDLDRDFAPNLSASAAVVFENDSAPELTVGFVDYYLGGKSVAPRGKIFVEKGFHLQLGRFDVPFGNDWLYFANKDRITVSPPWTTDLVMNGGYNEWGLRAFGAAPSYNYVFMILQGVGAGSSYGGRIGFTPFTNPFSLSRRMESHPLEVGFSYLYDINGQNGFQERAWAFDFDVQSGGSHLVGEFMQRDNQGIDWEEHLLRLNGFHVTWIYRLPLPVKSPLSSFCRFDRFQRRTPMAPESPADAMMTGSDADSWQWQRINRLVAGLHWSWKEAFQFKLEYQQALGGDADLRQEMEIGKHSIFGQVVFVF